MSWVNVVAGYSVMVIPMDHIRYMGHVLVAYSVMVIPMDDIWVIGQSASWLLCHGNTHGSYMGHGSV